MVCLGNQGLRCSTCNKQSCKHVSNLHEVIKDLNGELSPRLKEFANYQGKKASSYYIPIKMVSNSTIPFVLPPHLKNCLKEDYSQRFNLCSGIANLIPRIPPSPSLCSLCAQVDSWSEEVYLAEENFLVTPQCCYPAKGIISIGYKALGE